jgi:hypothetical protein
MTSSPDRGAAAPAIHAPRGEISMTISTIKVCWPLLALASVGLGSIGCQDANTKMCLDETAQFRGLGDKKSDAAKELLMGAMQSCAMSCETLKKDEACPAYKELSEATCDVVGKDACKRICDTDKNKYACDKAKSM